jgi:protein-S-isoprenylcysteine O-methyltransferase Ste14
VERALMVRAIALYGPIALVALSCALRMPSRRRATAALLACAWTLPSLVLVNVIAQHFGWWRFAAGAGALLGMPVELLLGWVVLWGALPVLAAPRWPLGAIVVVLAALDVATMPLLEPALHLGDRWLVGEVVAIGVALIPAQLLAHWTWRNRHVGLRAAMQAMVFAALMLWLLPEVIFLYTHGSWSHLMATWNAFGGVHLQLALLPAIIGLSAVQEFAVRGRGTPVPFDPPRRLVTTGPYAYVANPMQLSMALVLTAWGLVIGSLWVALAGPMSFVYSLGLAAWDEESDLGERFGAPWREYRTHVRAWIPRLRPYHASCHPERSEGSVLVFGRSADPSVAVLPHDDIRCRPERSERSAPTPRTARLYVAETCGPCAEVAAWFAARHPRGLEIVPAELHPSRDLERITYEPGDESGDEEGVAAVARALEHVHLGWALIGWTMRLPLLRPTLQLIVDASGGAPRRIPRASRVAGVSLVASSDACARYEGA